jgi:UDP-N-acetylmuramoyl-L-alanyl-D-glutamate--2,6-diaminopimelate ligase
LTNDNPRKENPLVIANEVKGNYLDKFEIILDRKIAIKTIINESNVDDIILILGRGNEEYQHIDNQKEQM